MNTCLYCHKDILEDMDYCGHCGRRVKPRVFSPEEKRTNGFLLVFLLATLLLCYIVFTINRGIIP